ncbi:MAG: phosphoribosylformylglycinamidine cyclo-ligase [Spirochaetes bacterium]|nr:phosphoribosylformylglycinamidine cyclo-ligase [Spirochaetota bacterium]
MGITYKDSGVDVEGGNRFVKRISTIVKDTFTKEVLTDIGGFAALFDATFKQYNEPVLVSSTDGVGTKLKIAQMMNIHTTIGIDAVAMCVNDIVVTGAKPLFFLDYLACGKLHEDVLVDVITGIATGCKMADCALIGGETAEHPNVMQPDDYDIAGFSVGVVDKQRIINGSTIQPGDVIIGVASSGIHSNGYSLVRKLLFDIKKYTITTKFDDLPKPLGEVLLEPTRIYVKPILKALETVTIKGLVHITGGGFYENIPRILPHNTAAYIEKKSFPVPPIFQILQREGKIEEKEMFTTFNMGVGMMCVVAQNEAETLIKILTQHGEHAYIIGTIQSRRDQPVVLC